MSEENARTYAEGIAQTVRDLDALTEELARSRPDETTVRDLCRALDLDIDQVTDEGETPPVYAWLRDALDAEVLTGRDRLRVEVLVTYGGPNAWVIFDDRDEPYLTVSVYWGGDSHELRVCAPQVCEVLNEYGQGFAVIHGGAR